MNCIADGDDQYYSGTQLESDEAPENPDLCSCTQIDDNVRIEVDAFRADVGTTGPNGSDRDRYRTNINIEQSPII